MENILLSLGVTVSTRFIPWTQSRNSEEKYPSLNWVITLIKNKKEFLATDYMAGMAHCPSFKMFRTTVDELEAIKRECQTGKTKFFKDIKPNLTGFISSICSDAETINYPDYESWARDVGYDPDSRTGEAIYRQCLEIALKLRNAIGEDGIEKLKEACKNY